MIGGFNPYSAYKDSGVPWLGKVPAHWEVPLKALMADAVDQTSLAVDRNCPCPWKCPKFVGPTAGTGSGADFN